MADTAALVVALSAQLTKFEKDMKQAVTIADQHTKQIETTFSKMNVAINNQLTIVASSAAARLGPVGSILSSVGAVGLTVAASLGVLAAGFVFLTDKVDKFADQARALKEVSEATGFTTAQLDALRIVGEKVGLSFDQTQTFVTRFALAVQELRSKGSGPLFDVLAKINPQLVLQVAAAKDVAAAIDLVSAAFKRLNEGEQLELTRAISGGRNLAGGRLLGAIPQGGVAQAIDQGFSDDLIQRVAKLRQEIEAIQKRTDTIWGTAFSIQVLNAQKQSAEFWNQVAQSVADIVKNHPQLSSIFESISRGAQKALDAGKPKPEELTFADRFAPAAGLPAAIPKETFDADARAAELRNLLGLMQRWTAVLGDALTQEEAYRQKVLELKVAVAERRVTQEQANRAQAAFDLREQEAAEAIRERLGLATEQSIADTKIARAKADLVKIGESENLTLEQTNLLMRESKEAADALAVRQAYFPGLKQLELDAQNTRKAFDQLAVHTVDTLSDGFADIILKTKTVSEAFKSMTDSILRDLLRLLFRQAVFGPLAGLLQPSGGGGFASLFAQKQSGGPVSSGHAYVVGEHGPELFVPQSSGHIVPNAVSGGRSAGGTSIEINNYTAADSETKQTRQQGPNGERIIIDIVKKAQARGQLDDVNRGRFALRPAKVR